MNNKNKFKIKKLNNKNKILLYNEMINKLIFLILI